MKIADRQIGPGCAPYVIAEIGVNHDGKVERAQELVEAAHGAGAEAIKLQFFKTDLLMSSSAKLAAYQQAAGETDPVTMLRRLELSLDEMGSVVERAHERGLHAIVTVFSTELVEQAQTLEWDAFKTASPDVIHQPLLEAIAATGRPMIVSTGASMLEEVVRAVGPRGGDGWLAGSRDRLAVLQCVSSYPAPEAALGGIGAIHTATGLPVGYSDHTKEIGTGQDAVLAGAAVLERHLTYDPCAQGPDHSASLDPAQFAEYVERLPDSVPALSESETKYSKAVFECERDVRRVSRQSIVSRVALEPGHLVSAADLTSKRPGTGIEPFEMPRVIGRRVARPVAADVPIVWEDLES